MTPPLGPNNDGVMATLLAQQPGAPVRRASGPLLTSWVIAPVPVGPYTGPRRPGRIPDGTRLIAAAPRQRPGASPSLTSGRQLRRHGTGSLARSSAGPAARKKPSQRPSLRPSPQPSQRSYRASRCRRVPCRRRSVRWCRRRTVGRRWRGLARPDPAVRRQSVLYALPVTEPLAGDAAAGPSTVSPARGSRQAARCVKGEEAGKRRGAGSTGAAKPGQTPVVKSRKKRNWWPSRKADLTPCRRSACARSAWSRDGGASPQARRNPAFGAGFRAPSGERVSLVRARRSAPCGDGRISCRRGPCGHGRSHRRRTSAASARSRRGRDRPARNSRGLGHSRSHSIGGCGEEGAAEQADRRAGGEGPAAAIAGLGRAGRGEAGAGEVAARTETVRSLRTIVEVFPLMRSSRPAIDLRCRHPKSTARRPPCVNARARPAGTPPGAAACCHSAPARSASGCAAPRIGGRGFVEQLGELVRHGAAELLGVDDGDGAAVIARHVVADADGDQLDRRARLDLLDHLAQVALEIVAGIDREGRSRRPARRPRSPSGCGAARCAPSRRLMRPVERLAVDVLLQQALAHHQPEILARPPPRGVGGLVDDVAQVVEAARIGRLAGLRARLRATARPSRRGW